MLTGLCLALYVVVAVVVFLPASPWSATRVPTGPIGGTGFGDSVQMSWFLEWTPYAILHGLNPFHTALIDYPKGVDLANGGSSSALLGLVASPFTLTLGPVAAFNVMLRLALASSAGSMFLLLRRWCRWPIAFVGGLLFGFGPYMTTEAQSHLNLVFVPLFPVMVWVLYDVLVTRRRRPILMGALLGGLVGAQFLIDAELLAMFAVLVAVGLCVLAVVERRRLRARFIALALAAGPAAAVALAITGYPLWEMLVAPGHLVGTAQPIDVLQLYRADLLGPVVPTASQLLHLASLSETARRFDAGNATENASYLGVPFIALVSFLAVRFRRDRVVLASSLLGLAALVLSLGSRLTVDGHATGLALPEALFTHLPLLDNVVPARFAFAATLFLVIAVAVGADHVADSLRAARSRAGRVGAGDATIAGLLGASLVFCAPHLPIATESPGWPSDAASTLATIPTGSVVLTYPLATYAFPAAMSWQAVDKMRFSLIGGYATVQGGPTYGTGTAPLLGLPWVQEFLTTAQYGYSSVYPAPSAGVSPRRALCRFIATYHVGAVAFWDQGAQPGAVASLFTSVLGAASHHTRDGAVSVWSTSGRSCP